jgi:hypothetical protein
MDNTQLFDQYQTDGSANPLKLTITIGYAQAGSTGLMIDNVDLIVRPPADVNGNYPGSFSVEVGKNDDLVGKTLQISPAVTKIQPTTDSSVMIELRGGTVDKQYGPLTATLNNPGDIADYYAEIKFV